MTMTTYTTDEAEDIANGPLRTHTEANVWREIDPPLKGAWLSPCGYFEYVVDDEVDFVGGNPCHCPFCTGLRQAAAPVDVGAPGLWPEDDKVQQ
jgi:hypothetical protein